VRSVHEAAKYAPTVDLPVSKVPHGDPDLRGVRIAGSELIYLLAGLDRQFAAEAPGGPREILLRPPDRAPFPALRRLRPIHRDMPPTLSRANIRSCRAG
jgi:hypothetical protein